MAIEYISLIAVVLIFLVFIILYKNQKRLKMSASSSISTQTTLYPALANPTGNSGYLLIEVLEKHTLEDIRQLESIALENETRDEGLNAGDPLIGTGRCSTALASLCFATVEQIGLILRSDLSTVADVRDALKKGNVDNAKYFFDFFASEGLPIVVHAEIESVYSLFRNKITHNLFPKHNLGIAQNKSNPLNQLVIQINGIYSLNINFLSNYVKQAIPVLKGMLSNITAHSGLIIQVEHLAQRIDDAEEANIKATYNHTHAANVAMRPYFQQWMPGITF